MSTSGLAVPCAQGWSGFCPWGGRPSLWGRADAPAPPPGTTCFSSPPEGASLTTRAPSAGWKTTWTTQVRRAATLAGPGGSGPRGGGPILAPRPPQLSLPRRFQPAAGQRGLRPLPGHRGPRGQPAPARVQATPGGDAAACLPAGARDGGACGRPGTGGGLEGYRSPGGPGPRLPLVGIHVHQAADQALCGPWGPAAASPPFLDPGSRGRDLGPSWHPRPHEHWLSGRGWDHGAGRLMLRPSPRRWRPTSSPRCAFPWCTRRSTWRRTCWPGSTSASPSAGCPPSPCPTWRATAAASAAASWMCGERCPAAPGPANPPHSRMFFAE